MSLKVTLWVFAISVALLFVLAIGTVGAKKSNRFYYGRLVEIEGLTNCSVVYETVRRLVLSQGGKRYSFFIQRGNRVIFCIGVKPVRIYSVVGREWQVLRVVR